MKIELKFVPTFGSISLALNWLVFLVSAYSFICAVRFYGEKVATQAEEILCHGASRVSQPGIPFVSRNPSISICSVLRIYCITFERRHSIPFWLVTWLTRAVQQIWWKQKIMNFFLDMFCTLFVRYLVILTLMIQIYVRKKT
jgi:hypothetical protein